MTGFDEARRKTWQLAVEQYGPDTTVQMEDSEPVISETVDPDEVAVVTCSWRALVWRPDGRVERFTIARTRDRWSFMLIDDKVSA